MIRTVLYTNEPIRAAGFSAVISAAGLQTPKICADMAAVRSCVPETDVLVLHLTAEVTLPVLAELKRCAPQCKIVLWANTVSTALALQATSLGVRGILLRTLGPELVKCLQAVHQGELWFEKALTNSMLFSARVALTKREGELVTLLGQGMKNKEIAARLMITEGTVKVYLSKLFQKVGVKDRFELALHGLENLQASSGQELPEGLSHLSGLRSLVLNRPAGRTS